MCKLLLMLEAIVRILFHKSFGVHDVCFSYVFF